MKATYNFGKIKPITVPNNYWDNKQLKNGGTYPFVLQKVNDKFVNRNKK